MGGKSHGPPIYVALMRGLNVGGNNRLPMAQLRSIFEELGCASVASYIQSGNIVFGASKSVASGLAAKVQAMLASRYGYHLPVILRTHAELRTLANNNPFLDETQDPKHLHLMCLADPPSAANCHALETTRFTPDRYKVVGKDIYLYFPGGTARSKLTNAYFDRTLKTTSTVRNWNTLNKLVALSSPV